MNSKDSAINWSVLTKAERVQGKMQAYFDLLKQVRKMEEDPELAAALTALGDVASSPVAPEVHPGGAATSAPAPARSRARGAGDRLIALARPGERFNAHALIERATGQEPELARMIPRQANDHLRRAAEAGKIRLVTPGKRGKAGSMPFYELVTDGTSAAESEG